MHHEVAELHGGSDVLTALGQGLARAARAQDSLPVLANPGRHGKEREKVEGIKLFKKCS